MIFTGKLLKILFSLCIGALVTAGKRIVFRNSTSCNVLTNIMKNYLYRYKLYQQNMFSSLVKTT